jgi:putative membrane protein
MNTLVLFFKGMVMGVSNIIPGVSGGTMAFIMGIYEKLTEAIGQFISIRSKRKEYAMFLALIFGGALGGVLIFARILTWLLASPVSRQHTYFFVVGLILGSIPFILRLHKDMRPNARRVLLLLSAAAIVAVISTTGGEEEVRALPEITYTWFGIINITAFDPVYSLWLMFCGVLAASSMILPGISGSALLIILGEYGNMLHIIDERLIIPLIFFGVGVIPGIIISTRLISSLIRKYPSETYYFILGLIAASIYQIYLEIEGTLHLSLTSLLSGIILLIGFAISYSVSRVHKK